MSYIDVNAGKRGRSIGQVAIVQAAAHELTHWMKENNSKGYEDLKSFMLDKLGEWKGKTLEDMVKQKQIRDRRGTLTESEALDEVIADGCEMMLRNTKVMQTMSEEKPSLFKSIKNWLDKWRRDIGKAFEDLEAKHEEAQAMLDYMEGLQQKWDAGIMGAAENAGEAKSSEYDGEIHLSEKDVSESSFEGWTDAVENMSDESAKAANSEHTYVTVADVTPQRLVDTGAKNLPMIMRFDALYLAIRESGVFDGHYHGLGKEIIKKLPAKLADPDVVLEVKNKKGKSRLNVITSIETKTGEMLVSLEINAVRDIGGKNEKYNIVVTAFDISQRYLTSLFKNSGAEIKYKKEALTQVNNQLHNWLAAINARTSTFSISDSSENINNNFSDDDVQFSERDFVPDDRELLLEAATYPGAGAELRAYAKKYKVMDGLKRKLDRIQSKGKDFPVTAKEKATISETQTKINNVELALLKMEQSPELQAAADTARARWREENPDPTVATEEAHSIPLPPSSFPT